MNKEQIENMYNRILQGGRVYYRRSDDVARRLTNILGTKTNFALQ